MLICVSVCACIQAPDIIPSGLNQARGLTVYFLRDCGCPVLDLLRVDQNKSNTGHLTFSTIEVLKFTPANVAQSLPVFGTKVRQVWLLAISNVTIGNDM